ncbi:sigma-70 family RNA polymerase sigma factor [Aggregatimonas sangjinii]|uniref:RNA polymerase sigma factor n=1 Tax=Aggregatimonas sangjinii TaxID=2583587 RepID=A0A5B7STP9_9FLAO|nr:sigma-70 family RNA polymerase sigma factor [Aggregatimonas sangjinii]QCX00378.1 sigma-70 family RNA polymerase sigma factor [Aggregatimonas sangjinii]
MEENQFLESLREGNNEAFGRLLVEYQKKVFNTCISFVPNAEDAEDLAQEVFIEVFNSISKFKGGSKLSTWIYRISVNKSLEFIRKKNAKKRFGFMQSLLGNDTAIDRSTYFTEFNHPGIQLENKEKSEILFAAINKLPEAQRTVYTLNKIDGMSYQEVADITQKSIGSIESLLFRAKKNLQGLLHDYYKKEGN